jgi:spoIIIJ-associated protein
MTEQDTSPSAKDTSAQAQVPEQESAEQDSVAQGSPAQAVTNDSGAENANGADATTDVESAGSRTSTESTGTEPTVSSGAAEVTTQASPTRPAKQSAPTSLLEREGEVAADFLEQLLDIADLDGDIDVDVDGDRAAVAIVDSEEGRVSRRLVGSDGQVLEALQELTRLAVQAATGERSRLMLDVAGYRAERRAAIVTVARGVIAEVKSKGEKMPLDPMTAFERKVVHDEVLAAGLVSESEGVEPQRHVVILPA